MLPERFVEGPPPNGFLPFTFAFPGFGGNFFTSPAAFGFSPPLSCLLSASIKLCTAASTALLSGGVPLLPLLGLLGDGEPRKGLGLRDLLGLCRTRRGLRLLVLFADLGLRDLLSLDLDPDRLALRGLPLLDRDPFGAVSFGLPSFLFEV